MSDAVSILDKGFVRLVDFVGGDLRVAGSARVTFGSASKGEQQDRKLIKYLLSNMHLSPFEHSVFQFHVKCPIFVARQWMRHRWGSYNEISARYTKVKEEYYAPDKFRAQDKTNKQGSFESASLDHGALSSAYKKCIDNCYKVYEELLSNGVAREMARMVLPVSQYTEFYWTVNARSLMNFISLRADSHAQKEIRDYAEAIAGIFSKKMPWTWAAFEEVFLKADREQCMSKIKNF